MFRLSGIPEYEGYEYIPIEENGEPLVSLRGLNPNIFIAPSGKREDIDLLVRLGLSEKLVKVANNLPQGIHLLVYDGWRPISRQKDLFLAEVSSLVRLNPKSSMERLCFTVKGYVSRPNYSKNSPAPHSTGGSIDLTLCNSKGEVLPLGSNYKEYNDKANTNYYEVVSDVEYNYLVLSLRRLLHRSMIKEGFTNNPKKWWHYDYGNQCWAVSIGAKTAIYNITNM